VEGIAYQLHGIVGVRQFFEVDNQIDSRASAAPRTGQAVCGLTQGDARVKLAPPSSWRWLLSLTVAGGPV
jgi:hypothetical protein